ncbi:MAG: hypothetical protein ABW168_11970 [Sedimenticola sp.]
MEIEENDKQKLTIQTGSIWFFDANIMPFGLCNAPTTFQHIMERYIDGINLMECLTLEVVFERRRQYNLKQMASK